MITSLAVGAVFTVEDRASPIIDRIAAQVERLDGLVKRTLVGMQALGEERFGGLSRSLAQVERRMGTIATSSERMSAAFVASTEAMVTGLAAATAQIGAMAAEMRSVAAATRLVAPGAAAAGGGGRGGGRGHGGLHAYAPLPGGVHARMGVGGAAALGIGVGAGMLVGIHGAAEEQLALRYALLAGGVNPDSAQGQQLYGQLRDTSLATSQRTIFSQAAVAKMMPGIIGMADVPIAQALPFMRPAIQFGEYERLMGKSMGQSWSAESSAAAAIRTSHLLGITDPGVMSGVMNMMVPATATAEKSPEQLVKIMQYMAGSARGIGMTSREVVEAAALGGMFMPGTTPGTSMNMLFQGLLKSGGPGAGTSMHRKDAQRLTLLEHMGVIDPQTKRPYRDDRGVLAPLVEHFSAFQYAHPNEAYNDYLKLFGGVRGARAAYEIFGQAKAPGLLAEIEQRENAFTGMGGVAGAQGIQMNTLTQQVLRTWASLQNVFIELSQSSLMLTRGFNQIANALDRASKFLHTHPEVANIIGTGAAGAAALAAGSVASRFLGFGGLGGAARAGVSGGAGLLTGASGLAGGAAALAAAGLFVPDSMLPGGASSERQSLFDQTRRWINRQFTGAAPGHENLPSLDGAILPTGAAAGAHAAAGGVTNNITLNVHVQGVTMDEIVQRVVAAVTGLLHNAVGNNSGPAGGANESAYTTGADTGGFP